MSPRLQRLATDWKTYAGLIAGAIAGLAAATDLVKAVANAITEADKLPPETKWVAAGLLAALSVLALVAGVGRRSILLRPDAISGWLATVSAHRCCWVWLCH
jgi:hypothetical protein